MEAPQGSLPKDPLSAVLPVATTVDAILGSDGEVWKANRFLNTSQLRAHAPGRSRVLKEGLKVLQKHLFHAAVLDAGLWMDSPSDQKGADRLIADLAQMVDAHAGMRMILLVGPLGEDWDALQASIHASEESQGVAFPSVVQWLRESPTEERLGAALEGIESDVFWRAQFLRDGAVRSIPMLSNWLVALSGSWLGFSEFSQRLPGLLIALLGLGLVLGIGTTFYNARTGVLATLVLLTTPLFFTSARVVGGDILQGVLLLAAIGVLGMWWSGRWRSGSSLALFVVTAILLFLSDGLHALLGLTLLVGAYGFVQRDSRSVVRRALAASLLLFGCGVLLVFIPEDWTVFHHFRFMHRLYSEGPSADLRTFEHFIRQMGFGLLPWSALLPLALGGLVRLRDRESEESTSSGWTPDSFPMLLFLGVLVPTLLHMATLRDFSHLVLPVAPVVALVVALLLAEWSHRQVFSGAPFAALLVFVLFVLLLHDLKSSPAPLLEFVASDPPFDRKDGAAVFPGDVGAGALLLGAGAVAMAVVVNHLGGLTRLGLSAVRWLRAPLPFALGALALWIALIARWVAGMMLHFRDAFSLSTASTLPEAERLFTRDLMQRPEHVGLLVLLVLLVLRGLVVATPPGRRWASGFPNPLRSIATRCGAVVGLVGDGWSRVVAVALAAGLLFASAVWGVGGGEVDPLTQALFVGFRDPGTLVLLLGFLALLLRSRLGGVPILGAWIQRWPSGAVGVFLALALLLAYLGIVLVRTLWIAPLEVWIAVGVLMAVGWRAIASRREPKDVLLAVAVLASAWGFAVMGPLVMHWATLSPTFHPEGDEGVIFRVLLTSRMTLALFALCVAFGLNGLFDRIPRMAPWAERASSAMRRLESGPVTVGILVIGALGMAVAQTGPIASELSLHVSQKHILERWHASSTDPEARASLFKHGNFTSGDGAVNFYTVDVPEVSDARQMLDLLARTRDGVARVRDADGRSRLEVFGGWNPANDQDGDGKRDWLAVRGFAEEVRSGLLIDRDQAWEPNQWRGHLLIDSSGRAFPIESNTSDTLKIRGRPASGGANSASSRYAIDDARAVDHRATGASNERVFFILGGANFSELNDKFRKRTDGRHISVLDDRSSRFVLASSALGEGEENQNRIAKHVLTREQFEALEGVEPRKVAFGDELVLIGVQVHTGKVRRKDEFSLSLYYEVLKTPKTNWKVFMHIERPGTTNRIHGDHYVLNQAPNKSQKKCEGCFRARHWRPGDIIVDRYSAKVTSGTPSGSQEVWMGFFNKGTDKRLPVKSFESPVKHDGSNRVSVARFSVR